jgi:hypothetical protein
MALTPGRWGIVIAVATTLSLLPVLGVLGGPFRHDSRWLLLSVAPLALTVACAFKLGLRASIGSTGFLNLEPMQADYYSITWAV